MREAILRYKFKSRLDYLPCFGDLMAQRAADCYSGEFDLITWVPVSRRRLRKRGFDQARYLTGSMCVDWHTEPVETLEKVLDNPPQSGLLRAQKLLSRHGPAEGALAGEEKVQNALLRPVQIAIDVTHGILRHGVPPSICGAARCLRFDDRVCVYTADALSQLDMAYAVTVHKSQGSEYRCVVLEEEEVAALVGQIRWLPAIHAVGAADDGALPRLAEDLRETHSGDDLTAQQVPQHIARPHAPRAGPPSA